jgi:hypothetical protein
VEMPFTSYVALSVTWIRQTGIGNRESGDMRYRKDLLVTDAYFIKGHASSGGQRLSTFLGNTQKPFLEMDEVTLIKLDRSGSLEIPWLLVRIEDILIAYEIEETGDEGLKVLAEREADKIRVTAHFVATASFQLIGKVRRRALNTDMAPYHDFIVMIDPKIHGFDAKADPEFIVLEDLPYVIINRKRIALILD